MPRKDKNIRSMKGFPLDEWGYASEEAIIYDNYPEKEAYLMGVGLLEKKDGTQEYITLPVFSDVMAGILNGEYKVDIDIFNEPMICVWDKYGNLVDHNGECTAMEGAIIDIIKAIPSDRLIRAMYEYILNRSGQQLGNNARYVRDIVMAETQTYYSNAYLNYIIKKVVDTKLIASDAMRKLSPENILELVTDCFCLKVNEDTQYAKAIKSIPLDSDKIEAALKDEVFRRIVKGELSIVCSKR